MAEESKPAEPVGAAAVDPVEFARSVAETPDEQLEQGLTGDARYLILDGIFERAASHFNADKAGDLEAVVEWRILDAPGGGEDRYQMQISGGACKCVKDGDLSPRVTFSIKPVDFLKLVTGNASGPKLFMFGRLKIQGDLLFSARVQSLFWVPETGEEPTSEAGASAGPA